MNKKIPASEYEKYDKFIKDAKPCEDCVSREAIFDAFWKLNVELRPSAIDAITNMINNLPSVTPKQRTGNWIDKKPNLQSPFAKMYWCDQCGAHAYKSAYCPGCGAKMEVESEDRNPTDEELKQLAEYSGRMFDDPLLTESINILNKLQAEIEEGDSE